MEAGVPNKWDNPRRSDVAARERGAAPRIDTRVLPECKSRPAPRRGGGKGRRFVPWCK